jgi:Protein of unknown function (DUF4236)
MGFRFPKRIRIVPGLWINLSKKGGSLSVGGHGLTANISKKGVRETVGLPGTGISYQTKRAGIGQQHRSAKRLRQSATPGASWRVPSLGSATDFGQDASECVGSSRILTC